MTAAILSAFLLGGVIDAGTVSFQRFDDDGCSFTVSIEEPSYSEYDGRFYPCIRGMYPSLQPDRFVLPFITVYVPVPPDCLPGMHYFSAGRFPAEPPGPLLVTPVPEGSGLDTRWGVPATDRGSFPSEIVELRTFRLAGTRVAAVTVSPCAAMETGWIPSSVTVDLSWPSTGGSRPPDTPLLRALLHEGLEYWPVSDETDESSPFWGRPWARLAIASTGIYVVTGEELEEAGISLIGTPSPSLRMFTGEGTMFDLDDPADRHQLREIPVEVMDGDDGVFNRSDTLKFFGLGLNRLDISRHVPSRISHRYADHNVYWLTWGAENGLRMDTLDALPDGSPDWGDSLRFDIWQEQDYFWLCGQDTLTGWVWTQLFENIPGYFYFSTPSADGTGTVRVLIVPESGESGPFTVAAELNGTVIADTTWSSSKAVLMSFDGLEFDAAMNLLKITATQTPGKLYIDYVMADYPRRLSYAANRMLGFGGSAPGGAAPRRFSFSLGGAVSTAGLLDLTDPFSPVRLRGELNGAVLDVSLDIHDGCNFWLEDPEGFRSPDSITSAEPGRIIGTGLEGDVAVVVADPLLEASQPLETIYAARGLSVAIVSAGEVYDEFGQGLRDPGAIRSFFRHTQDGWSRPASALLLVGDGSYDPMMHVTSYPTLIPVCLILSGEEGINLDDKMVIAHEGGMLPEAPVSRITASSAVELSGYLSKVMAYDRRETPGQWENRIVLAADDEWGRSSVNEYGHTETCDTLADSILPASLDRVKFYLIEYPWPPGTTPTSVHPEKPEAHAAFVQELSRGCAGMIFFGHGSYGQLAHEKILVSSDVLQIDNGDRQPVMIFASCDLGHFDMISAKCLSEDFEMAPGSGSIVSIGATRLTFGGGNEALFIAYYQAQYGDNELSVGDALWLAKAILAPGSYSNSRYYVLLGDGGVYPVRPSSTGCSFQVQGDTLFRGRLNEITGEFVNSSSGFMNVTESGTQTVYSGLGSGSVEYLHYGSGVYQGFVSGEGNSFTASFFMPVQADTGSYSRGSSIGVSPAEAEVAFREWIEVSDDGDHENDSLPPVLDLWIEGHRGEEQPKVCGESTLRAILSDSSGICAMGGGAGRSILLSLDNQGFDVSRYFNYHPDSYTVGELEYPLPEMVEGEHRLIMAAWDGMGNSGRDTLDFTMVQASGDLLSSIFVYPNPGHGQRCFNFQSSSSGTASIKVYTVAGRCIWSRTFSCEEGYNQVMWDGLDMDGDPPASGAYIYRIEYSTTEGASAEFIEVLAVVREQ
ncbi:MAG: hypothetical protein JXA64_11360 [Candidatus Fermentibacteraceae bacterium]|nr:hypothetical protein [Candidatus Fermentibacteraceae bacterium]